VHHDEVIVSTRSAAQPAVLLATPIDRVFPNGALEKEINYLLSHGYVVSPDGWKLIAP
jgi:hypothetical protein